MSGWCNFPKAALMKRVDQLQDVAELKFCDVDQREIADADRPDEPVGPESCSADEDIEFVQLPVFGAKAGRLDSFDRGCDDRCIGTLDRLIEVGGRRQAACRRPDTAA